MERSRFRKLFRDAERLEASEAMWRNIAARAGTPAAGDGGHPLPGHGPGWRLAASMAVGLGVLAGMFMVMRDPDAAARKGAEQSGSGSIAMTEAPGQAREEVGLLDPELLGWHADLGEVSATDWEADPLLTDPTAEE